MFSSTDFYDEWDKRIKKWLDCKDPFNASSNPLTCLNDNRQSLSLQHLPEPYYGDMDNCSIVIINLNPGTGLCEQCHLRKAKSGILVNYVNNTKYSTMAKGFPLDKKMPNVPMPSESLNWWDSRLEWINHILDCRRMMGITVDGKKKPFAIELVPLHSKSFKVSNAAEYVRDQYPEVLDVIDYAIDNSDAKMGLAIGKPIYNTLKNSGYTTIKIFGKDEYQPEPTIQRFYSVLQKDNKRGILCTWSSGSNKAPSALFQQKHEDDIIKYIQP